MRNRRLIFWFATIAWMGVIYYFSSQPNSNEVTEAYFGGFNYWVRKGAHISEYAILFALAREALAGRELFAFIISVLYAATDEFHQTFVAGRTGTAFDVCIDSLGPLLVCAARSVPKLLSKL